MVVEEGLFCEVEVRNNHQTHNRGGLLDRLG